MKKRKYIWLLVPSLLLGGIVTSCNETKDNPSETISVTSVSLNKATLEMFTNDTFKLIATINPNDAKNKEVTWSSSNTNVATIDEEGLITSKGIIGTTTITVTTVDGNKTATCEIKVKERVIPVESITLSETTKELFVGEEFKLVATVLPENATNKDLTFTSSDVSIATVNEEGLVITKDKVGEVIITATTVDGNKTATCTINVKEKIIPVQSVTLLETTKEVNFGEEFVLNHTILPDNATNKEVIWKSSDESVATVDKGKVSVKEKVGETTITVTTVDGNKTATCLVKVKDPIIHATTITLDKDKVALEINETYQIEATISPDNLTDPTIKYELVNKEDEEFITISETGLISSKDKLSNKTIDIKVFSKQDPTVFTICKVIVGSLEFDEPKESYLGNGDTYSITLNKKTSSEDKEITFITDKEGIVSDVTFSRGQVTFKAIKEGEVTITALTTFGFTSSVKIKIIAPTPLSETLKAKFFKDESLFEEGEHLLKSGSSLSSCDVSVLIEEDILTISLDHDKHILTYKYNGLMDKDYFIFSNDNDQKVYVKPSEKGISIYSDDIASVTITDPTIMSQPFHLSIRSLSLDKYIAPTSFSINVLDNNDRDIKNILLKGETYYPEVKEVLPQDSKIIEPDYKLLNINDKEITDPQIGSISSFGTIVIKEVGEYKLVAKDRWSDLSSTTLIKVVEKPSIELVTNSIEIDITDKTKKYKIEASLSSNPYEEILTYKSTDNDVIKVDEEGNLDVIGTGECEIIITSSFLELKEKVSIKVINSESNMPSCFIDKEYSYADDYGSLYVTLTFDSTGNLSFSEIMFSIEDNMILKEQKGNVYVFYPEYYESLYPFYIEITVNNNLIDKVEVFDPDNCFDLGEESFTLTEY